MSSKTSFMPRQAALWRPGRAVGDLGDARLACQHPAHFGQAKAQLAQRGALTDDIVLTIALTAVQARAGRGEQPGSGPVHR
jgi:hypothetical protein